ncbi:MAG: nicotinamide mononucleotide transporter, partial [Wohlfahrtiimonas sp.]
KWNEQKTVTIIRMPQHQIGRVSFFIFTACIAIYLLLKGFTVNDEEITMGDTIATALSIVAIWMAAKFWAEQWCLLIPANLITAALLLNQGDYASGALFMIYFIVSIFGLRHWIKLANQAQS